MSVAAGGHGINATDEKNFIEQNRTTKDDLQKQQNDIQANEKGGERFTERQADVVSDLSGEEDGDHDEAIDNGDEDEEEDDDDEDDEEPALKYERIIGDLPTIFKKDSGSAIAMSKNHIVSGLK